MVAHAAQPWSTPSYRCLSPPSLPACNCCWCALIIHFIIVLIFYLLNANRRAYAPLPPSTACLLPLPPPPPSTVMLFLGVAWLVLFLLLGLGKCFAQIVNGLVSFCSNKWNQCHAPLLLLLLLTLLELYVTLNGVWGLCGNKRLRQRTRVKSRWTKPELWPLSVAPFLLLLARE